MESLSDGRSADTWMVDGGQICIQDAAETLTCHLADLFVWRVLNMNLKGHSTDFSLFNLYVVCEVWENEPDDVTRMPDEGDALWEM